MAQFWVVGGEFTDTSFKKMAGDGEPRRYGPFDSHAEALAVWRAKSMETVDLPLFKYSIHEDDATAFWVVGGHYADTNFKDIAGGGAEEREGPFGDYARALEVWRAKPMATVDDAHARYRIEKR
ncbi:MAG: DUF4170 domain-containing protein [Proteobacteria bacterium]|nr:DUF4170 domain-containing protein [Pseudomonadota bacterium]